MLYGIPHLWHNFSFKKNVGLDENAIPNFLKNPKRSFRSLIWNRLNLSNKIFHKSYDWPKENENPQNATALSLGKKIGHIDVANINLVTKTLTTSHIAIFKDVWKIENQRKANGEKNRRVAQTMALSFLYEFTQKYPTFNNFIFNENHSDFFAYNYTNFYLKFSNAVPGNAKQFQATRIQIINAWIALRNLQRLPI